MKKKKWFNVLLVFILIGGVSLFTFNQNAKERKEQQMIKMETITAKQIKNTFADVAEIKFSEDYIENTLAGFTSVYSTISTDDDVVASIGATMSLNNKAKNLRSYIGGTEFEKGVTENEVKVIFSNKAEGSL